MEFFVEILRQASIENPWRECRLLLAHCLGITYEDVFLKNLSIIPADVAEAFKACLERRLAHEPLSRIIGKREFWGQSFVVTPDTLDPRPDSETLIEAVLERFTNRHHPYRILDVGTGTGCLLISLLKEYRQAQGVGVDICPKALATAQLNAQRLLQDQTRAQFVCSHWVDAIKGQFDIIVSNPPYIGIHEKLPPEVSSYDPALALYAGEDGLSAYQYLVPVLKSISHPSTCLFFELGYAQSQAVQRIIEREGATLHVFKRDINDRSRVVMFGYGD